MVDVSPARPPWATRTAAISLILAAIFLPIGGYLLFQDASAYWGYATSLASSADLWQSVLFDSGLVLLGALLGSVGVGLLQMRKWVWIELIGSIPLFMALSAYQLLTGQATRPLSLVMLIGVCAFVLYILSRPAVRTLFR